MTDEENKYIIACSNVEIEAGSDLCNYCIIRKHCGALKEVKEKNHMKFLNKVTNRGFKLLQFYDDYDELCDIQESSNVVPHIWLGVHSANPKILASKTPAGGTGWVNYEIPDDVLISTRMHLNRKQCMSLGLKLLKYGLFEKLD